MGTHTIRKARRPSAVREDAKVILDAVRQLVRALRVSSRACERASGKTSAQIFILEQLARQGQLSVNELAEHTFTHQSTVSVVVGRLIADGLVARTPSKKDARRIELTLTRKGVQAREKSPRTAQEELAKAILSMTPAKRRTLGKLFQELVEQAGFVAAKPPLLFEDSPTGDEKRD